jgi:hypothetical protein
VSGISILIINVLFLLFCYFILLEYKNFWKKFTFIFLNLIIICDINELKIREWICEDINIDNNLYRIDYIGWSWSLRIIKLNNNKK